MPNFDDFAKRTRTAHEQSVAEREEKTRQENAKRDADFKAAATALLDFVGPLFEQAKDAFERVGAPCVIKDNWRSVDYGRPMRPELTFQCIGPVTQNSMGGTFEAKGRKVFASYDGTQYRFGIGNTPHSNHVGDNLTSSAHPDEQALSTYLEAALKSYLEDDAAHRR